MFFGYLVLFVWASIQEESMNLKAVSVTETVLIFDVPYYFGLSLFGVDTGWSRGDGFEVEIAAMMGVGRFTIYRCLE